MRSSDSSICEERVIDGVIIPYHDKLLADCGEKSSNPSEEETDINRLNPSTSESKFNRISLKSWCRCQQCNTGTLVGSLEFQCCREVNSSAKMVFDGSLERIKCITQHEDYDAITNHAVLLQVDPLLRNQDGGTCRRRGGMSENEFIRAVAYRWTTRWLCGYMGWDNRRPLPACVYHNIRTKYHSQNTRGFAAAQDRE
ncbi:uncharacterized protein LOC111326499 [Stylophora pistillata]|uniref:uncharacterized protein LOC111326499 n=1 Tax=Stylophora pistillata TaxID=50429 RepID=UPI000C04070D|nr:uncharacterized protein LOC111326499 [Stylophora pistillata]